MKVPNSIEDAFIPMEEQDIVSVQEQREKRDQYWAMLFRARQDFLTLTAQASIEYDIVDPEAFFYFLKQNYGLQVATVDGNKITSEYTVIDEKKYLLFLIKYSQ